uniref:Pseudouridine synthase RsuA/RluA-like domain-containing protein n=1 Tax=Peronospora matthiolae TaxID=2874970 RepID=A0AAV1TJJ7_9STRA
MGTNRRRDALATNALPAEATQELNRLIASALQTLQLPVGVFDSTEISEDVVSDRIHSLGLIKLKQVPNLQPPGSVYSSDLAIRLFYSCRKAGVVFVHTKAASNKSEILKQSEILTVDDPQKLAKLCLNALNLELIRRPYRHVVRVWLPDKVDIALGAQPDRILVQTREFAKCKNSDAADAALRAHLPLKILFRDDALIVVEKPANVLSVDGADSNALPSVHRCIANVYPEARMVHRLDQETSGLLVVALTKSAAQSLNAQFRDRSVEKIYVARVDGWIMDNQEEESESPRCLRVPMEKHPTKRLVQRVISDRVVDPSSSLWSCTEYWLRSHAVDDIQEDWKSTIVDLKLVTGKTHQLRLHMQHLGHPILGDSLYSPELVYHRASRLCLHAAKLAFTHPVTNERLSFESLQSEDFFSDSKHSGASQRPHTRPHIEIETDCSL